MNTKLINICYNPYSIDYYSKKDIPEKSSFTYFKQISDEFKLIGIFTDLDNFEYLIQIILEILIRIY